VIPAEARPQNLPPEFRNTLRQALESDYRLFCAFFFHVINGFPLQWNEHHDQIVDALMRVVRRQTLRLVINVPPRYSKTELVVILFIAWCLAKWPPARFIHLSYSDDLALDNSSRVREIILCAEFQALWPLALKKDSDSKKKWYTEQRGGVYAASTGGPVTGFGAGLPRLKKGEFGGAIIYDDPIKPEDAESDVKRALINRRFNSTFKSRRNSNTTPEIMIMQRVHDDDPTGFVLRGGRGDDWEHLCLKALSDEGKPLWPEKHDYDALIEMQKADKYVFSAQYQQNPVPDDGEYFLRDKARWYDKKPQHLNVYGASDYAVTEGGGDFTEHGVFGVDPDDNIYILDWWSGQEKADVWIETQLDMVDEHDPLLWGGETGPIKSSIEPWLERRMRERRSYVALRWVSHSVRNKEGNARSFQALWEQGRVYLPKGEPWALALLEQLTRFPKGRFDDKVDVCSIFARMIAEVWKAHKPKEGARPLNVDGPQPITFKDLERDFGSTENRI